MNGVKYYRKFKSNWSGRNYITKSLQSAIWRNTKGASDALTGVTQRVGHCPVNQHIAGSIPSQGTSLDCRPGPQLGECEKQAVDVSLTHGCFSFSLPSCLSKNK